jgi:hypothetical protein
MEGVVHEVWEVRRLQAAVRAAQWRVRACHRLQAALVRQALAGCSAAHERCTGYSLQAVPRLAFLRQRATRLRWAAVERRRGLYLRRFDMQVLDAMQDDLEDAEDDLEEAVQWAMHGAASDNDSDDIGSASGDDSDSASDSDGASCQ